MVTLMFSFNIALVIYLLFAKYSLLLILFFVVVSIIYCLLTKKIYFLLLILSGSLTGSARFYYYHTHHTKVNFPRSSLNVTGQVISLPRYRYHAMQFDFLAKSVNHHPVNLPLQLRWYGHHPYLQIKDSWQLKLKLKNGLNKNWFLAKGLQGRGYVVKDQNNKLLKRLAWYQSVDVARQTLAQKIRHFVNNAGLSAVLVALSTGSRNYLLPQHWKVFQYTGTSHLIAISGLHVSLVAGLVYFIIQWLWCRSEKLILLLPAKKSAALFSLLFASLYAVFAGWSLPTQRALIMIAVVLIAELLNRHIPLWYRLLFAFSLMLLLWPLSLLSIGFCLSYSAVMIIAGCFGARLSQRRNWRDWFYLQYTMFVGLLPLTLLFFGRLSLVMLLANIIAVPYMSLLIVPCCLLATTIFFITPAISGYLWAIIAKLLTPLWWFLSQLSALPHAVWQHPLHNRWAVFSLCISATLLLMPRRLPTRFLAAVFVLPLFFG